MFKEELDYFIENQEKLLKEYNGKALIIKGRKVIGTFDSVLEAYLHAKTIYKPGTFMIQECTPGPQAYTVTIRNCELFC